MGQARRPEAISRLAAINRIGGGVLATLLAIASPVHAQSAPGAGEGDSQLIITTCSDTRDDSELLMIERARRLLSVTSCASSAWLDGLFGDEMLYEDYRKTYGTLSVGTLWDGYDGFDPRVRFRMRLQLPQWSDRFSVFAGRVGQDDYISDVEDDFDALPSQQFGGPEHESLLLGLGYSEPRRTGNDFDASVGVKVGTPLDPYVRTRYEFVRHFAERYVFSLRETLFWQDSEGFGSTTRSYLDRSLATHLLARWLNVATYTQESEGVEWYSQLTLFQSGRERTGLAWQAQVDGATGNEVPITRYAVRAIMRRQFRDFDWLFLELRGGVDWPREELADVRKATLELGIALEIQFGRGGRNTSP